MPLTDREVQLALEHLKGLHDFTTTNVPDCEFCVNEAKASARELVRAE